MLFSVLFVRIITKSTKAVLFGFSSDEDDEDMGFVTRDVLGMGACNKMPTARMHITIFIFFILSIFIHGLPFSKYTNY